MATKTVGWRVMGLVKQDDGTRILGPVSSRVYQSKEAADELRMLCNRQDKELQAYMQAVERRDRLGTAFA